MDVDSVVAQVRAVIESQLRIAGDDEAISAAGDAMLAVLMPALKQAGTTLAEQAAAEIGAQLVDHTVDVVLEDGQPTLVVREQLESMTFSTEDFGARMTVRLTEELKNDLEAAASDLGDSVNTFVVRALAGKAKGSKRSNRATFEGTIDT